MKKFVVSVLLVVSFATGLVFAKENGIAQKAVHETQTVNYSQVLKGKRLFLDLSQSSEEKTCTGFTFLDDGKTVLWHGDHISVCGNDVAPKMRIQWIDNNSFVLIDKNQNEEQNCPPRNYIYKVVSVDNKKVVLEEVWTGWNEYPNEKIIYHYQ